MEVGGWLPEEPGSRSKRWSFRPWHQLREGEGLETELNANG